MLCISQARILARAGILTASGRCSTDSAIQIGDVLCWELEMQSIMEEDAPSLEMIYIGHAHLRAHRTEISVFTLRRADRL